MPPAVAHAFAAEPGSDADLLVMLTPGVERFGYFRVLDRLGRGQSSVEELLDSQELYDNYFLDSAVWRAARQPPAP